MDKMFVRNRPEENAVAVLSDQIGNRLQLAGITNCSNFDEISKELAKLQVNKEIEVTEDDEINSEIEINNYDVTGVMQTLGWLIEMKNSPWESIKKAIDQAKGANISVYGNSSFKLDQKKFLKYSQGNEVHIVKYELTSCATSSNYLAAQSQNLGLKVKAHRWRIFHKKR